MFGWHDSVYFGRHPKAACWRANFQATWSRCVQPAYLQIRHSASPFTRKWDLASAPSVCVHCSLGCNTFAGERSGVLRRILNRYNEDVNGYFLCDRGRFGYEFVNDARRVREPRLRRSSEAPSTAVSGKDAIRQVSDLLASARRVIGIGSPRASLEANFALRTLVGPDRFYAGVSGQEQRLVRLAVDIMNESPARIPSLGEVSACDAVLVLGEDIGNTAPMLHLQTLQCLRRKQVEIANQAGIAYWDDKAVRAAAPRESSPLFIVATGATGLDPYATSVMRLPPADIGRIGFAIGHLVDGSAPAVEGLAGQAAAFAGAAASALEQAERPLIISGVNCRSAPVLKAAANVAWALRGKGKNASLCLVMPECNSFGLALLSDRGLDAAFEDAQAGDDIAIVLENDIYRRLQIDKADDFLAAFHRVVVIDHLFHRTALGADMLLPAATFAEEDGTFVNNEGRAQRYFQVFPPGGLIRPGWRWLTEVMAQQGRPEGKTWRSLDALIASMAKAVPLLGGVADAAPGADFRIAGMKIAREHRRCSGRTAVSADATVHEPPPPCDEDAPFTFSMEGYGGRPPSALTPRFWAPGWNSIQSVNKFQAEVGGPLAGGDPGVRLIEPDQKQAASYFDDIPAPFVREGDLFLVVPFYRVFGSEELSMLGPGVRERSAGPCLAMSSSDMASSGLKDGDAAALSIGGRSYVLPAMTAPELAPGIAAIPSGVPDVPVLDLPAFGQVRKAVR